MKTLMLEKTELKSLDVMLAELDMQINREDLVDNFVADGCMFSCTDTCEGDCDGGCRGSCTGGCSGGVTIG